MQNPNQQDNSSLIPDNSVPASSGSTKPRASLQVDSLEPRILLSATMIDADAVDHVPAEDSAASEVYFAEAKYDGYAVDGTENDDWMKASDGDDLISGMGGDDHLYGLGGNDSFIYREGDGTDIVLGGEGVDSIDATEAKTLHLTEFTAKHSVESIVGNDGGLQIEGTANDDFLDFQQTSLKNVAQIDAGDGNDQVTGSSSDDIIAAGGGNDTLSGGKGDGDVLVLSGNRDEYKIIEQKDGSIEFYDSRGTDGNDLVRDFEKFEFADETVSRDGLFRDPADQLMISDTSVSEDASGDTVVGKLYTANDADSGPHAFALVDEKGYEIKDENFFIQDNALIVREGHSLNFESDESEILHVRVTDGSGSSFVQELLLNVKDANDAPESLKISDTTVSEDATAGTVVGKLSAGDEDKGDTHSYSIVDKSGQDVKDANFEIRDNTIVVRDGHSLNYESSTAQTLFVKATDASGASYVESVTIDVKDANDAPVSLKVSDTTVSEDATAGTVVGKLSAGDEDRGDTHSYSIVDKSGQEVKDANFEIRDNAIVVRDGHSLNYESSTAQTLFVKATDASGASYVESVTIDVKDANDAPISLKISDSTVSEDATAGTVVSKLSAVDEDRGDTHSYSIVDKSGQEVKDANFEIRDNTIVVRDGHSLNYESSTAQTLFVRATDASGASYVESVTIDVKDANDAPISLKFSDTTVSEDATAGTVVGKLSAVDEDRGDTHSYSIVDKSGQEVKDANFEIRDNTIVVRDGHSLNYESSTAQTLFVRATDASGASYIESVTINVNDANDAPNALKISDSAVSEDATAGTVVGKLSAGDEDKGDTHSYSIVDKSGQEFKDANFEIRDNTIVVRDGHSLNYESNASQTLFVKATDASGASYVESVTIDVKDANDAPISLKFSDTTVSEDATAGTIVGKLSAGDEDKGDTHSYSIVDKSGQEVKDANFEIRDNTIVVRDGHSLNYESSTAQTLFVKATDASGASYIESVTININDANDAPNALKISDSAVSEDATAGTVVGKLSAGDEDKGDTHSYSIVDKSGQDVKDANFEIRDNTIVVRDGHSLNYESSTAQTLFVRATDASGASYVESVTIDVKDANDAPISLKFSDTTVSEDATAGTIVGKLSAGDEDKGDTHSYSIVDKSGQEVKDANFAIRDNAIVVRDGHSLNYESSTAQTLFVRATDASGASCVESVTIDVKDANDAPISLKFSDTTVSEDATAGTVVGKLSAGDEDRGDTHSYSIVDKSGQEVKDANFEIRDNTIVVRDGHSLNYESSTAQTLFVSATDASGASYMESVTINVNDANDAPVSLKISDTTVSEDATAGTVVGKLSAGDEDKGDTHSYSIVDKSGQEVKDANFEIRDNTIVVRDGHSLNYESSTAQTLFVSATDASGASYMESVTINVNDANDAPVSLKISDTTVSEDATAGTVVGKLSAGDEDKGDTHSYSIVDKSGQEVKDANFEIRDNTIVVRDGHSLNYESSTAQTLFVKATDASGASYIESVTININDANDAPNALKISDSAVSEDATAGTVVGKLSAGDEDRGDTHSYSIVDKSGQEVKDANFEIRDNTIVVRDGHSLNYESSTAQTLFVRATDASGASYVESVTIDVKDANDAPVSLKVSDTTVSEDATAGTVVGKLSAGDEDKGDTHSYSIVDKSGQDVKDANFEIRDNTIVVRDGHSLNYESSTAQTLFVKATDASGASYVESVTIDVKDANDAPISLKFSDTTVSEDATAGTIVGKLSAGDEDRGDTHSYSIVDKSGQDVKDANFEIRDNTIVVRDGHSLNYESSTAQTLFVRATDASGASYIESVTINVNDANDAPISLKINDTTVSEDANAGTIVGKLSAGDEDRGDTHSYSIVDKSGQEVKDANFEIRDNAIVVRDGHSLNYESSTAQTLFVKATDASGASYIESITININDANDAPVSLKISDATVSEDATAGTVVGKLSAGDEDKGDTHTYQLVDAKGNEVKDANFEIRDDAIVVRDGHSLNYESSTAQTLFVRATDASGASYIESVTINVNDANDAPISLKINDTTVSEDANAGTIVGKLSAGDEDKGDTHSYSIVDKSGQEVKDANFEIRDDAIVVRDGHSLNYESSTAQTLFVKATDASGASYVESVTIDVKNANDAPISLKISDSTVSEDATAGTVVGKLSAGDEDKGDTHSYSIVDKSGQEVKDANFAIRDNAIVVRDGHSLNYESSTAQTLFVKATDASGASYVESVTIDVKDANDAPVSLKVSDSAVSEDATAGTVVGKLSVSDEDKGDTHSYSIVDKSGQEVKDANFEIRDNAIVVRDGHSLNYESSTAQTLFVKATDASGASYMESVTINVNDANDAPVAVFGMITTREDQPVTVRFHAVDDDTDGQISQYLIETLPSHGQLLSGGRPVAVGDVVLAEDLAGGRLQYVPDKNWHGDERLAFRAFDGHEWSSASADVHIIVTAVADTAQLTVEPTSGMAGSTISLNIAAHLPEGNSSEELRIHVDGVPDGAKLNAGVRQLDGTWTLESKDLTSLTLTLPSDLIEPFRMTVSAVTLEANGDTTTATAELDVTIIAENELDDDSQNRLRGNSAAIPYSAISIKPPETPAPGTIIMDAETPPVRFVPQSASATATEGYGVTPLGYSFLLPITETPDWSNTVFGDVRPVSSPDSGEPETGFAASDHVSATAESTETAEAAAVQSAAATNPLLWIWSAARALGGIREERKTR